MGKDFLKTEHEKHLTSTAILVDFLKHFAISTNPLEAECLVSFAPFENSKHRPLQEGSVAPSRLVFRTVDCVQ